MRKQYSGSAPQTSLDGSISDISMSLDVVDGTGYPDGSVGPFVITIDRQTSNEEKILCSSRTNNNIVIEQRGYDGTQPSSHSDGAIVLHTIDAESLNDLSEHAFETHHIGLSDSSPSDLGDSDAGTSETASRSDHTHKIPSYVHDQGTASAEWVIYHNLGKFPSVTVQDSAGTTVVGTIDYVNENELVLSFRGGFSGKAYLA